MTRGCYDTQGLRAGADYLFWWVGPSPDDLQEIYTRFRRTRLGRASEPVWSVMALHRPAEFSKDHIPAFLEEKEPKAYLSVYPFVRSYDWYLLDPRQRREMLAEHGMMGREYPDVQSNTVACFSLNDYEWVIALEADDLHRIVDLRANRVVIVPPARPGEGAVDGHRRASATPSTSTTSSPLLPGAPRRQPNRHRARRTRPVRVAQPARPGCTRRAPVHATRPAATGRGRPACPHAACRLNEPHRIVELMHHRRGAAARRHVPAEIPFFTGRRKPVANRRPHCHDRPRRKWTG